MVLIRSKTRRIGFCFSFWTLWVQFETT